MAGEGFFEGSRKGGECPRPAGLGGSNQAYQAYKNKYAPVNEKSPVFQGLEDGDNGTRTRGLLTASQALPQLSYIPGNRTKLQQNFKIPPLLYRVCG